jgi:hypothetical protein
LDLDYLVLFQLALVAVAPGADGADEGLLAGVDADVGNVPLAAQEPLVAHLTPAKIFFSRARSRVSFFTSAEICCEGGKQQTQKSFFETEESVFFSRHETVSSEKKCPLPTRYSLTTFSSKSGLRFLIRNAFTNVNFAFLRRCHEEGKKVKGKASKQCLKKSITERARAQECWRERALKSVGESAPSKVLERARARARHIRIEGRVARFFLVQHTKTRKNIPKDHKVFQLAIKFTNWP